MSFPQIDDRIHQFFNPSLNISNVTLSHAKFAVLQNNQDVKCLIPTHNSIVTFPSPSADERISRSHVYPLIFEDHSPIFPVTKPNLVFYFASQLPAADDLFK